MAALAPLIDGFSELVLFADPATTSWENLRARAHAQCAELLQQIEELRAQHSVQRALQDALDAASKSLGELQRALDESSGRERWQRLYGQLARAYEELRPHATSQGAPVLAARRLSSSNYTRNVFHALGGLGAAALYHFFLDRTSAIITMVAVVVTLTALELVRHGSGRVNDLLMRIPFFKKIARPHEYYRFNSSTWYAWGLLLAALAFPPVAVQVGCVVLGVADPLASNFGRRFGRRKIFGDKSWVGSTAFFLGAVGSTALWMSFVGAGPIWLAALVAAAAGTIAEIVSGRLDDNFTVPVAVAAAVAAVL